MEIILAITQSITLIALLIFFFLREHRHRDDDLRTANLLESYFTKVNVSKDELVRELSGDRDALIHEISASHLKHVANLEKMIVTPKQPEPLRVDPEEIRKIMSMAAQDETINNPIEETNPDDTMEFTEDNLRRIPITRDTRVMVEDTDLPTEVFD